MRKGKHIILDCFNVPEDLCLSDRRLLEAGVHAANAGGATIINTMRYRFGAESPAGCAAIIMLDESHISIHTYADPGVMAIDVFVCGKADARLITEELKSQLQISNYTENEIERF